MSSHKTRDRDWGFDAQHSKWSKMLHIALDNWSHHAQFNLFTFRMKHRLYFLLLSSFPKWNNRETVCHTQSLQMRFWLRHLHIFVFRLAWPGKNRSIFPIGNRIASRFAIHFAFIYFHLVNWTAEATRNHMTRRVLYSFSHDLDCNSFSNLNWKVLPTWCNAVIKN